MNKFLLSPSIMIYLLITGCNQTNPTPSTNSKASGFQLQAVSIELPKEIQGKNNRTTHQLKNPIASPTPNNTTPKESDEKKAGKTENNIIFYGRWLNNLPSGKGDCYKDKNKTECHYFKGILIHNQGDNKRNQAMQRCLGFTSKQLAKKHPSLKAGSSAYKEEQLNYLYQCYQATEKIL